MKKTRKIFAMLLSMTIIFSSVAMPSVAEAKIKNAEKAKKLKTAKLLSTSSGLAKKVSKQDAIGMFIKGVGYEKMLKDTYTDKQVKKLKKRISKKVKDIKKVKDKNFRAFYLFYLENAVGIKNKKANPNDKMTGNEFSKYLLKGFFNIKIKSEKKAATRLAREIGLSQSYAKNLAKRKVTKDDVVGIIWAIDNMEMDGYKFIEVIADVFGLNTNALIKAGLYANGTFTIQDFSLINETGAIRFNFDNACVNNNIKNWDFSKVDIYINKAGSEQREVSVEKFKEGTTAEYIGTLANYTYYGNKNISVVQSDFVKQGTNEEFTAAEANKIVSSIDLKPARLKDEFHKVLIDCSQNGKGMYFVFNQGAVKSVGEYKRFNPVLIGMRGSPSDESDYFVLDLNELYEQTN